MLLLVPAAGAVELEVAIVLAIGSDWLSESFLSA